MTDTEEYTATEIAEKICAAQELTLGDNTALHNRLKYIAKRGVLKNGRAVDGRGTLAFAKLEVFRAAVFVELIGLAMDFRALEAVTNNAATKFAVLAASQKVPGGSLSRGGLVDAINGVAAGEQWFLKLWRVNPGLMDPEHIAAAFVPEEVTDAQLWDNADLDKRLGRKPSRAHVTVDLTALFLPIIELVGTV